jgi:hypothetical protein
MNKRDIQEIMRPQYEVLHSENGIEYELRTVSMFKMIHICDYYYRDLDFDRRGIKLPELKKLYSPVYFHHNDYWMVDGMDLSRVITYLTIIHRRDWRKVVNGKWRLQPDWWRAWYDEQREKSEK